MLLSLVIYDKFLKLFKLMLHSLAYKLLVVFQSDNDNTDLIKKLKPELF